MVPCLCSGWPRRYVPWALFATEVPVSFSIAGQYLCNGLPRSSGPCDPGTSLVNLLSLGHSSCALQTQTLRPRVLGFNTDGTGPQALWLCPAYFLEFEGANTFFLLWLAGLGMLSSQLAIVYWFIVHRNIAAKLGC